jgi:quercetin dioxygenase-like cupin family protein
MARAGDMIFNPVTGQRMIFRQTAQETNGRLVQIDEYLPADGQVDVEHLHPLQEETFRVITGTLKFIVDGREIVAKDGETVVVPAGTPHAFGNIGEGEALVRTELRPALNMEGFFESYFGLAQDGKLNPQTKTPDLLQTALTMHAFRREMRLAAIPAMVQRLLFGTLAPIGRLMGRRAHYPYPYATAHR